MRLGAFTAGIFRSSCLLGNGVGDQLLSDKPPAPAGSGCASRQSTQTREKPHGKA